MKATTQYFGTRFFVLEFHRPSNFYTSHLGVKTTGHYCAGHVNHFCIGNPEALYEC
jgi:hypothetical protein